MLGVAVAEAPTATPLRTVNVEGVAKQPIAQNANAAAATAVYREAAAAAVGDGQAKASFLAGKLGATLGQVQTIVEDGGYIDCRSGESEYAGYEGEEPDFGTSSAPGVAAGAAAPSVAATPRPAVTRTAPPRKKKHKRPTAKKANVESCTLTAEVSLVYTID
jgi:hypothetical protein